MSSGPERDKMEPGPVTNAGLPPHSENHLNVYDYTSFCSCFDL
jgi:hypothetical protein